MTAEDLRAFREAENRKRMSRVARVITGLPDRRTVIRWQEIALADRVVRVRVHRPSTARRDDLPLVLHVHGGGFVGTAVQCDWVNSHLAARLPAVVVSVEHRLLAPGTPLTAAVDDGWDVLDDVVRHANPVRRQPDPHESADGTVLAARRPGGNRPPAAVPAVRRRPGRAGPALVVVPTFDPMADHGRSYAQRLQEAGTPARLTEHPGATHAFLSMPGVVPQARPARAEILGFLQRHLAR